MIGNDNMGDILKGHRKQIAQDLATLSNKIVTIMGYSSLTKNTL